MALAVASTDPSPPTEGSGRVPGFEAADTEALDLLSDIVGRYIETIGLNARENANAAGRTKSNAYDVLNALGSLSPRPLSVTDLYKHAAECGLELPFDRAVPEFPARKKNRGRAYGSGVSPVGFHSAARPQHVPSFLPPFPANQHATAATRPSKSSGKGANENRRLKRIRQQQASQAGLAALHGRSGKSIDGRAVTSMGEASAADTSHHHKQKRSKLRHQQIGNGAASVGVTNNTSRFGGNNISGAISVADGVHLDAVQKDILAGTARSSIK